jgi:hypothetical protein
MEIDDKLVVRKTYTETSKSEVDLFKSSLNFENYSGTIETTYKKLMDHVFEVVGNPVMHCSITSHLIYSRSDVLVKNRFWNDFLETGEMDISTIDDLYYRGLDDLTHGYVCIYPVKYDTRLATFAIIYKNTMFGYFSMLEYCHPFRDEDLNILKIAADFMGIFYASEGFIGQKATRPYLTLLCDLLDGQIIEPGRVDKLMKTAGWKCRKLNRVIVIDVGPNITDTAEEKIIENIICRSSYKTILYDGNIIVLEEYDTDANNLNEHTKLVSYLTNSSLQAGISDEFTDLENLSRYFKQAKRALQIGTEVDSNLRIFSFDNYRFDDMLIAFNNTVTIDDSKSPVLLFLEKYDASHNSNLSLTLFTFLKNNRSILKSSDDLHVHKNTLSYRINKIKDLTNLDFDNYHQCLHFLISYECIYHVEHMGKPKSD